MADIREKVAKLLALATSPNEQEAQAALLKARELMAKHKLRPEECQEGQDTRVIVQTIGVECTKMTDTWALALGGIIGKRYCCKVFRHHAHGAKKVEVGFAGLADDFEVCRKIYLYAHQCVKNRCERIQVQERRRCGGTEIREMCNTYGWGFCYGLEAAFQEQEREHQEWGLVLAVPQAVDDAMNSRNMSKTTPYGKANTSGWRVKYANAGYAEGKKFVPEQQLEPGADHQQASA